MRNEAKLQIKTCGKLLVVDKNISIKKGAKSDHSKYLGLKKLIWIEQGFEGTPLQSALDKLQSMLESSEHHFYLARVSSKLVGYGSITQSNLPSEFHIGCLDLGLLNQYNSPAIKKRLLINMEGFALQNDLKRIEQKVIQRSYLDVQLNISLGYSIEGKLSHSALINGGFEDSYIMGKFI